MLRKIIAIDKEKCDGCGLCVDACHEGAIGLIDGKAELLRDDFCDGLGDCLPVCPRGAISFEHREAKAYDEAAVNGAKEGRGVDGASCSCPGGRPHTVKAEEAAEDENGSEAKSELRQWPVQIKLAPVNAGYFDGANLLIAADCCAYARGSFHKDFMRRHITLIGCPKLDEGDYTEKLTRIIRENSIKSVTVARMEVPCCGGIERAVVNALRASGKMIPWRVVTLATDGSVLED